MHNLNDILEAIPAPGGDPRVVVGMSGGVDSSVAAFLLKRRGYEVIGVTMHLWTYDQVGGDPDRKGTCCGMEGINDARAVCHRIGAPHYVADLREAFGQSVIRNFVDEYLGGRTPNPCVMCNHKVKWDPLLRRAQALGAGRIATGHYARVAWEAARERYVLRRSEDPRKDQSYVLWGLSQGQLRRTLFPLGGLSKETVREVARGAGLQTADKAESQDICFVVDRDVERFMRDRARIEGVAPPTFEPGPVVDREDRRVGTHRGAAFYTVGQRRGVGVAAGAPLYVIDIEPETNTVRVGGQDDLLAREVTASAANWIAVETPVAGMRAGAKMRYRHDAASGELLDAPEGRIRFRFDEPQRAVTPGQSLVLYDGDLVLGGGIIDAAIP
ncbi:MAG: tRNA 2-thiouridine(34) synthase MnmA [Candidatus Handelsmanbacteria bacterium RIFCSPLOWO2_12_FULL_64_10]|uniref:tRNA-specific 2-thiouridylase MnmA n=1 Tax=Handelsmanbacteria sp. (strain RIFCSPLOWO2_12_FULL_64_10) TaxID=1817868 RepID=A0A1F6CBY0_HANXR|nr:MAG: tRNA 2-thiouridine(34) synthase MnmA [Candidatus Handelsmanbacteria bacterium RIFCSPLOWO2_12_FULL_64_10]